MHLTKLTWHSGVRRTISGAPKLLANGILGLEAVQITVTVLIMKCLVEVTTRAGKGQPEKAKERPTGAPRIVVLLNHRYSSSFLLNTLSGSY